MINQLRKIYPSLIVYAEGEDNLDHTYKWFVINDDDIFKKEISFHIVAPSNY